MTVLRSTTAESGDNGPLRSAELLCGLEPGADDGTGIGKDFNGEGAELREAMDVLDPGDLDRVDDGAVDGAVESDNGVDKSALLRTDEKDDEDPEGVGR